MTMLCLQRQIACWALFAAISGCAAPHAARESSDHAAMSPALQDALETTITGNTVQWWNVYSGDRGMVTPLRTYISAAGIPCREYEMLAVAGRRGGGISRAIACRDDDGVWKDDGDAAWLADNDPALARN